MKATVSIRSFALSIVTSMLLMLLSSCRDNRSCLSSDGKLSFFVTYSKNEITIESSKTGVDCFFYKEGEYFASSDSILFFSTLRDTILNVTSSGNNYRIVIEKDKNGEYKTSSYFVNDKGCLYFLISYCYDAKYHVTQIEKCDNIVCK